MTRFVSGQEFCKKLQEVLNLGGKPIKRIVIEADVESVAKVYVQYYLDVPAEAVVESLLGGDATLEVVQGVTVDADGNVQV
jgi:hypothetical protein